MDEIILLQAKLEDTIRKSDSFGYACTHFLSPKELFHLQNYVQFNHPDIRLHIDGGYPDSERKLLFVLSDYFEPSYIPKEDHYRLICIQGSGYCKNTHRDYLGSLLALGISREMIGDICIEDNCAYVFVLPNIESFLLSEQRPLVTVGRDKVKVCSVPLDRAIGFVRSFEKIHSTVASLRLDCVVSAIVGISRDKSEKTITLGVVTHNYEIANKPSSTVKDGDIISVKGYGKFIINVTDQLSKKGKIKINAMKYK